MDGHLRQKFPARDLTTGSQVSDWSEAIRADLDDSVPRRRTRLTRQSDEGATQPRVQANPWLDAVQSELAD